MSSRSFMDAIRGVVLTEGAKDKTSDGMTKDAKRFAQDLHKVSDPGMKHMVQKDSETKDYEKMFKGNVEKFPTRLADVEPSQGVDKYVEYNEAVEAKKKPRKEKEDEKPGDSSESEDGAGSLTSGPMEAYVAEVSIPTQGMMDASKKAAFAAGAKNRAAASASGLGGFGASKALPTAPAAKPPVAGAGVRGAGGAGYSMNSGKAKPITGPVKSPMAGQGAAAPAPANKTRAQAAAPSGTPTWGTQKGPSATGAMVQSVARDVRSQPGQGLNTVTSTSQIKPSGMSGNYSSHGGTATNMAQATKAAGDMAVNRNKSNVKVVPTSGPPPAAAAAKPGAAKPAAAKPAVKPAAGAAKPAAGAAKPAQSFAQKRAIERGTAGPQAKGGFGGVTTGKTTGTTVTSKPAAPAKKVAGVNTLKQSYEIEVNGTSYLVSEAHAAAIAAFVEKHGVIDEGTAGEFIHKEMQHPEKLTAKGKKQKIKQSLAIYYSKKRRGENP